MAWTLKNKRTTRRMDNVRNNIFISTVWRTYDHSTNPPKKKKNENKNEKKKKKTSISDTVIKRIQTLEMY